MKASSHSKSAHTPLPAQKFYANEGLCQVLFFLSDETRSQLQDKKGKYQAQSASSSRAFNQTANSIHLRFLLELKDREL